MSATNYRHIVNRSGLLSGDPRRVSAAQCDRIAIPCTAYPGGTLYHIKGIAIMAVVLRRSSRLYYSKVKPELDDDHCYMEVVTSFCSLVVLL